MKIYDRRSGEYLNVEQYGSGKLQFLYDNAFGRMLLWLAVSPLVSGIYGRINSLPSSSKKIPAFVNEYGIDTEEFELREYRSFNDFFTRRIRPGRRPIEDDPKAFISPADSKVLVYPIDVDTKLIIKGREYTLDEITGDGIYAHEFAGGKAFVFRLCMDDYHRYCFPDSGSVISTKKIKGCLHTVSPISKDHKIYKENTRIVSVLETDNIGKVIYIEVGALLVGKIVDHKAEEFERGQEKGYFEPGGSTIVVITKGNVDVDKDILEQSNNGIETAVRYGERIGTIIC